MKAIRITHTYWHVGPTGAAEPLVTASQVLPADDPVALRQLALRNAEEVDVPDPAPAEPVPAADPEPAAQEPAAPVARTRRASAAA